jgi:hypothetical protein
MSSVTPRAARIAAWIAIPAALVASGIVVSTASYSAFSSTTSNPTSNWTSGNVALTNDQPTTALFNATALKPGSTGSNCLTVLSTGSLPATVKVYGTGASTSNVLATSMNLTVEQGTGGGNGSCTNFVPAGSPIYTGTLAGFGTSATNFSTGAGSWTTVGVPVSANPTPETKVYRVTYTLPTNAPSTAQGLTASVGFTWEAQNN